MEKNLVRISIPVKPYVKKFIEVEYGVPTIITRRDIIGNKLFDVLHRNYTGEKVSHRNYTVEVALLISTNLFRYAGAGLNLRGVTAFNMFMESLIKDKQRSFICSYIENNKCEMQDAIRAFISMYESDGDDFNYDAIKKDYYRWRMRTGKNISPTCVPSLLSPKKMTHAVH